MKRYLRYCASGKHATFFVPTVVSLISLLSVYLSSYLLHSPSTPHSVSLSFSLLFLSQVVSRYYLVHTRDVFFFSALCFTLRRHFASSIYFWKGRGRAASACKDMQKILWFTTTNTKHFLSARVVKNCCRSPENTVAARIAVGIPNIWNPPNSNKMASRRPRDRYAKIFKLSLRRAQINEPLCHGRVGRRDATRNRGLISSRLAVFSVRNKDFFFRILHLGFKIFAARCDDAQ